MCRLYLYSTFAYCLVLCLVKPLVWPSLRQDSFIYPVTLVPPALTLVIRYTITGLYYLRQTLVHASDRIFPD